MKNPNKTYSFDIPNIFESLKISYAQGKMTLEEVADDLYIANITPFIDLDYASALVENKS